MEKKYQLRKDLTKVVNGKTLYCIEALKSFYDVNKGELGGYIESENNLSHDGSCWVYDEACVFDKAMVKNNARILDKAIIKGNIMVSANSVVRGNTTLNDVMP